MSLYIPNPITVLIKIRYCVDVSKSRFVDNADRELFNVIDGNNSEVPIVLILTKTDKFLDCMVGGLTRSQRKQKTPGFDVDEEARKALKQRATEFQENFRGITKSLLVGPILVDQGMPKNVLRTMERMLTFKDDSEAIEALVKVTTANVNSLVAAKFVAAQTVSVSLKRQAAITTGMDLFRVGTRTSMIPFPLTTTVAQFTCASLICKRGLQAFGYDNVNSDLVWATIKNNWDGTLRSIGGQLTVGLACVAAVIAFPPSILLGLASDTITSAATVTRQARVLVFCIADVVLILDKAFWVRRGLEDSQVVITDEDIRAASNWYRGKVQSVHAEIEGWLPVLSPTDNTVYKSLFKSDQVQGRLEKVIDKYRWKLNKNSSSV